MKNRTRENCTSGSVRDEAGQRPHLLGRRNFLHLAAGTAPKVRSNAGVPPEVYARELKRLNSFLEGEWNPDDSPASAQALRLVIITSTWRGA
jgi:hypothetical protein